VNIKGITGATFLRTLGCRRRRSS